MTRTLVAAAYAGLGALLVWSRFAGLGRGYCCDEIRTVSTFVREGPHAILIGPYVPNNHELFTLAGWATSAAVGESEIALRAWSAIPFVIGVAVATTWTHVRLGALPGIVFLLLSTLSPLLLDISWQARGYGLAFLAMAVLMIAALEAERTKRRSLVAIVCVSGTAGSLTLPHFWVAFAATGLVLLMLPELRRALLVGLTISTAAFVVWYAPHFDDIAANTSQDYGAPIRTAWLLTAPFDHVLIPALTVLDEVFVLPSILSLVWTFALAAVMVSSPLLRRRVPALIMTSGTGATIVAFWLVGSDLVPRFFSFLLVPLFILLASGSAAILARLRDRPPPVRTVLALAMLGLVVLVSAPAIASVPRKPREAQAQTAALILATTPESTTVHAHMPYSNDLAFHLGRPVNSLKTPEALAAVCDEPLAVVYVEEPWLLPPADLPCLHRTGVRHERLEQYARGGVIDIWFIPSAR